MEKSKKPKVSIIMAAYNSAQFLEKTLRSLFNQTFSDFELLIMDDGSTDNTPTILSDITDKRVKVFTQENAGLAASLNRLATKAQGDYLARADADDLYPPKRLEKQVRFLEEHLQTGVVGSFMNVIDEHDHLIEKQVYPVSDSEIRRQLRITPPFAHPVVMVRKSVFDQVDGYNESLTVAQDYDLWRRLSSVTEFANVPDSLIEYRRHKKGTTQKNRTNQMKTHREIRRKIWDGMIKQPKDEPAWNDSLKQTLNKELVPGRSQEEISTEIYHRRIEEANLAYGAKREDIGLLCLYEISCLKPGIFWGSVYYFAKIAGFVAAWKSLRLLLMPKFKRMIENFPTMEWDDPGKMI